MKRTDSRTLVYHNTSRLKGGRIKISHAMEVIILCKSFILIISVIDNNIPVNNYKACVFTVTCQTNLGSVRIHFFFIIGKTGNNRSVFRNLIPVFSFLKFPVK